MMYMSNITTLRPMRMAKAMACALLLACAAACDSSDESASPEQPRDSMAVSISIMTGKATATRAISEYDRTSTEKESIIDATNGDYCVFVFDGNGIFADRLHEMTPENDTETNINRYTISGVLDIKLLDFYIVVLANWKQNGYNYPILRPGKTTIAELMNAQGYIFDMPDGWQPFADGEPETGGMPMFGMHRYTVSEADAKQSTRDNPVRLAQTDDDAIWMMRSMAKIEVVDAMEKFGYSSYPKLESVTFGPYMDKGKLIPDAKSTGGSTLWINNKQVTAPSLPTGIAPTDGRLNFFHSLDTDRTNDGDDPMAYVKRDMMSAYIAEQDLTAKTAGGTTESPYMVVTVRNRPEGETGDGEETVSFRLDIPADMGTRLLRNHIYRFEIKSASANLINIEYVVCPWIEHNAIDLPAFD